AMRGGNPADGTLSDRDKADIERNCARDVLEAQKFAEATFVSSEVKQIEGGWSVRGTLTIHGVAHEGTFQVQRKDGRAIARMDGALARGAPRGVPPSGGLRSRSGRLSRGAAWIRRARRASGGSARGRPGGSVELGSRPQARCRCSPGERTGLGPAFRRGPLRARQALRSAARTREARARPRGAGFLGPAAEPDAEKAGHEA